MKGTSLLSPDQFSNTIPLIDLHLTTDFDCNTPGETGRWNSFLSVLSVCKYFVFAKGGFPSMAVLSKPKI